MEELLGFLYEQRIKESINTFRDILNEMMCCTLDETGPNIDILIISCHLDELIIEYMGIKKQIYK